VRAAAAMLGARALSPLHDSAALGPSRRRFANAVALVDSALEPPAMLARVKAVERAFGRRRGRRWGTRPIDLDLIAWSGGTWRSPGLTVPHVAFRQRLFVLEPLAAVMPDWRDPLTGLTPRRLLAWLTRRRPLPS
jgi:2-amino-4-hydroxy-6-hydroxymethyldihydropteridine diphosphokinase